jgi:hypothetical protein
MQKTTKIEAQGGEIVIRNSYDDVAIIPRNLVKKYQAYMKAGCDECIDELVASLPAMSQYAADGTVIPQGKKVKVTLPDGEQAEYSTDSVEYKNLYNSGKLANVVKDKVTGEDTYVMPSLKEVEITAEKPAWMKSVDEYKKLNPKSKVIAEYLNNGIAKGLGNTATNYPSRIDDEYEQKALDYAAKKMSAEKKNARIAELKAAYNAKAAQNVYTQIENKYSRVNYLNSLPEKQQELLGRLPEYQPGLWVDAVEGGAKLTESDPRGIIVSKVLRYLNDGNFTEREKRETMKQYKDHPVISQIEAVGKLLGPLNIPYNATTGNYYTGVQGEEGYTIENAISGQEPKNRSALLEMADPLNVLGIVGGSKVLKAAGKISEWPDLMKIKKAALEVPITKSIPKYNLDYNDRDIYKLIETVRNNKELTAADKQTQMISLRLKTKEGQHRAQTYYEALTPLELQAEKEFQELDPKTKELVRAFRNKHGYYDPRSRNAQKQMDNLVYGKHTEPGAYYSPVTHEIRYASELDDSQTIRHELEHSLQEMSTFTPIDRDLRDNFKLLDKEALYDKTDADVLLRRRVGKYKKEDRDLNYVEAARYFNVGSGGQEKSAFLAELQAYAIKHKYITHEYQKMTPKIVEQMVKEAKLDPQKALRILGIGEESADNYKLIADNFNKLLGLTGAGIIGGSITARSLKDQLNKNKSK